MELIMLGTGNAAATEIFNTCYVFQKEDRKVLVDGGGGNGLLKQLKKANINWQELNHIFITHKHTDHILGIFWLVRLFIQSLSKGKYQKDVYIYSHDEVIHILTTMSDLMFAELINDRVKEKLHFVQVKDKEEVVINGFEFTFFDIHSAKAKQFGYCLKLNDEEKLACCGDETFNESNRECCENSKWLLHEAFCLYQQKEIFKPYQKHHSTALDAGRIAEGLHVSNLLMYHTEQDTINDRKQLYNAEAKQTFTGHVFVPDDLEIIELEE